MPDAKRVLTESEREIAERLRIALGRLNRSLRPTHVEKDLSPSQREVLMAIARVGTIRYSVLSQQEGLNLTMLSRIVGKLESAGMVTRSSDSSDARVIHLTATPKAIALRESIRDHRSDAFLSAVHKLSKEEKQALGAATPAIENIVALLRDSE